MALQEQHIAIKFAGGIETKQDSKAVPSARLLALENGVFTKAISIKKRNGYETFTKVIEPETGDVAPSVYENAKRLGKRDDELLLFTNKRCYSHQTGDTDQWSDGGQVYSVTGSDRAIVHTGTMQTIPDHATNGDVTVFAWQDSRGGVYYTVTDANSGRVYIEPRVANGSGFSPRCVAVGPNVHIYYAVSGLNSIYVLVIDPANPSKIVTEQLLIDDLNDNPAYDACPTLRLGTPAAIVWHEKSTTNFRIGYVDSSGVLGSPATNHSSIARSGDLLGHQPLRDDTPLGIAYKYIDGSTGDHLAVAYTNTRTSTTCAVFRLDGGSVALPIGTTVKNENWLAIDTPSVLRCTVGYSDDRIEALYEHDDEASLHHRVIVRGFAIDDPSSGLGVTVLDSYSIRGLQLASRAFAVDNEVFAYFFHDTVYFNVFVALRVTSPDLDSDDLPRFTCVSRLAPGAAVGSSYESGGVTVASMQLPSVHVDGNQTKVCLAYKTRLESEDNDQFGETGLRVAELNFDDADSHQTTQLGRGLYMAGACPQHYDGRMWCEQGFHVGPELDENDIVTGEYGVGDQEGIGVSDPINFSERSYLYVAWYEYTDTQGEIHRGPTSVGNTVVMQNVEGDDGPDTIESQVTMQIPTYRFTNKERVRICVARSLANDATRLFRVTSLDPTTEGDATNGYLANDIEVDTVEFVDAMSDADLRKQEPLYTNGGILSNDPTALGNVVVAGKNRLFFSDCADPDSVRYSQERADGFGVECAPELVMKIDPFGGAVAALAVMDEFVIVFKESAIYSFNGNGPVATGDIAVSAFSAPQLITSDVGCTEPSSIVLTPVGLMFKSAKGIYLLDRSRQVQYAGAAVELYNTQTVRRATVMPDRSQIIFLTDSGKTLLFDYLFAQWSTFTNHEGRDAIVVDNTYHYLRNDDRVFRETIDAYSDAGSRITLRFETAWLHLVEHLQGLQRFWKLHLLGTWGSPHQLGIQFRTDFENAWSDPWWLDATGETDSTGWITGDTANTIGEDPITGSAYGDGDYGDGPYGGTAPDVYQWRMGLHSQGQSIQFRFEDFEKAGLAGATFELTEMTITGGVMKPATRPFTSARST